MTAQPARLGETGAIWSSIIVLRIAHVPSVRRPHDVEPIGTAAFGNYSLAQFLCALSSARAAVQVIEGQQAQLPAAIATVCLRYCCCICVHLAEFSK